MSTSTQRIKSLLDSLPKRDISIGDKFISIRDFESLKELVDSALYKTEKNILSEKPKKEYLEVDIDRLKSLKAEVDAYILLLDPNFGIFDDDSELEEMEEYY